MYEEGLISLDHIILSAMSAKSSITAEYFLPEIIEKDPETFHKEIKFKFPIFSDEKTYSNEAISNLKEKRSKFFQWILNCGDYSDPSYREIETDPLRLSIKMDDFDRFQKIISNSNISLNMSVRESIAETFVSRFLDISLIKYAINYNSVKIIKFLVMNDVTFDEGIVSYSIFNGNYDLVHMIESKSRGEFEDYSLVNAIFFWKHKISHYIILNYSNYSFLKERHIYDFNDDLKQKIFDVISATFRSCNFRFFKNTLLPFLRHNSRFVRENIFHIVTLSFKEMSCFFTKEFMKIPGIDVNYVDREEEDTFLTAAVHERNPNAVEYLLNNFPQIDVNSLALEKYSPLYYACGILCDMRTVKLLCNHPDIDISYHVRVSKFPVFHIGLARGNVAATKFLLDNYKDALSIGESFVLVLFCLQYRHLLTLKLYLNFLMEKVDIHDKNNSFDKIIKKVRTNQGNGNNYYEELTHILDELGYDIDELDFQAD